MPVTKVGIRYSTKQQVVRSIVHLDREYRDGKWQFKEPHVIAAIDEAAEWKFHQQATHPKETLAFIDHATYHGFNHHQQIHDHLKLKGVFGKTDRHAVVDENGVVLRVVLGDAEIDIHPDGKLIPHATALPGDKLS